MSSAYVTVAREMCAYFAPHTFYASNEQVNPSFTQLTLSIFSDFLNGKRRLDVFLVSGRRAPCPYLQFSLQEQTNMTKHACRKGVILYIIAFFRRVKASLKHTWSTIASASRAPRSMPTSSLSSTVRTGRFENETGCFLYVLLKTHDCGLYVPYRSRTILMN